MATVQDAADKRARAIWQCSRTVLGVRRVCWRCVVPTACAEGPPLEDDAQPCHDVRHPFTQSYPWCYQLQLFLLVVSAKRFLVLVAGH